MYILENKSRISQILNLLRLKQPQTFPSISIRFDATGATFQIASSASTFAAQLFIDKDNFSTYINISVQKTYLELSEIKLIKNKMRIVFDFKGGKKLEDIDFYRSGIDKIDSSQVIFNLKDEEEIRILALANSKMDGISMSINTSKFYNFFIRDNVQATEQELIMKPSLENTGIAGNKKTFEVMTNYADLLVDPLKFGSDIYGILRYEISENEVKSVFSYSLLDFLFKRFLIYFNTAKMKISNDGPVFFIINLQEGDKYFCAIAPRNSYEGDED